MRVVFGLARKKRGRIPNEGDGRVRPFHWANVQRPENTQHILRMTRTSYNNQFHVQNSTTETRERERQRQRHTHTPVSYTHLTLPTIHVLCRSRWSPYH